MPNANLSEKLFKPRFNYPETSTLIKLACDIDDSSPLTEPGWYRNINKLLWFGRGIKPVEFFEVISLISASKSKRSDSNQLDTVIGYRQGNWIYEWTNKGMDWQQKAAEITVSDPQLAAKYWLKAAMFYSLACYPHIRGDSLAEQAEILSYKAYQMATELLPYHCKSVEFNIDGNKLTGFLHLPDIDKGPYPTVLLCGRLDSLQHDEHRLFYEYFAPAGIAMLTIDISAIGTSSRWKLNHDTSYIHQRVLQQINSFPWVDGKKIYALGMHFGANMAIRLAYLESKLLAGVISWCGAVHYGLTTGGFVNKLTVMDKDVLASRMGLSSVSDKLLNAELISYSLKNQGLLGKRCSIPMMAIAIEKDIRCSLEDAELVVSSSAAGKLLKVKTTLSVDNLNYVISEITKWIKSENK